MNVIFEASDKSENIDILTTVPINVTSEEHKTTLAAALDLSIAATKERKSTVRDMRLMATTLLTPVYDTGAAAAIKSVGIAKDGTIDAENFAQLASRPFTAIEVSFPAAITAFFTGANYTGNPKIREFEDRTRDAMKGAFLIQASRGRVLADLVDDKGNVTGQSDPAKIENYRTAWTGEAFPYDGQIIVGLVWPYVFEQSIKDVDGNSTTRLVRPAFATFKDYMMKTQTGNPVDGRQIDAGWKPVEITVQAMRDLFKVGFPQYVTSRIVPDGGDDDETESKSSLVTVGKSMEFTSGSYTKSCDPDNGDWLDTERTKWLGYCVDAIVNILDAQTVAPPLDADGLPVELFEKADWTKIDELKKAINKCVKATKDRNDAIAGQINDKAA